MRAAAPRSNADLRPGDHIALLFRTAAERRAVLTPFLQHGLARGERVLYIGESPATGEVLDFLGEDGLDPHFYLERGQLLLRTVAGTFLRSGAFDPAAMAALLCQETEQALADGYAGLRFSAEMTWLLKRPAGSERLLEYEARLSKFLPGSSALVLCQYDRRRFSPELLLDVLRTHPLVIVGTELCENSYFLPPEELCRGNLPRAALRQWTANLVRRRRRGASWWRELDLLEGMLEASPRGFIVVDRQGQIVLANPQAEQVLGLSADDIIGRPYDVDTWQMTDLEGRPFPEEELPSRRVLATAQPVFGLHHTLQRADGQRLLLSVNAAPLLDAAGAVEAVAVALQDITCQAQAEAKRQEAERRYRTLVEQIPAITYTVALGELSRTTYISPQVESLLGFSPAEWLADPDLWRRQIHPQDRERVLAEVAASDRQGQPLDLEYRLLARDGRTLWFHNQTRLVRDDAGRPIYSLGVLLDITARKEMEEALARHTASLEALRQVGLELGAELDLSTLLHAIVRHAVELTAASGGGFFLCWPEEGLLEWSVAIGLEVPPLGLTLRRGEGLAGKVWESGRSLLVDDYPRWEGRVALFADLPFTAVLGVPVLWGEEFLGVLIVLGRPPRAFSTADRELLELLAPLAAVAIRNAQLCEDLRRRMRDLEETQHRLFHTASIASLGVLAGGFAHQVRNPLAIISTSAQLLQEHAEEPALREQCLQKIVSATERASQIVENLLRFAHPEADPMGPVDLGAVVEETLELLEHELALHGVAVGCHFQADLPCVWGSAVRLQRVFVELIRNAMAAMPRGGELRVATRAGGHGQVEVQVDDSGCGIPAEHLGRIFEPFFTTMPAGKGAGLGLSLSYGIIQQHGGTIEVESREGRGSRFTVRLPALAGGT